MLRQHLEDTVFVFEGLLGDDVIPDKKKVDSLSKSAMKTLLHLNDEGMIRRLYSTLSLPPDADDENTWKTFSAIVNLRRTLKAAIPILENAKQKNWKRKTEDYATRCAAGIMLEFWAEHIGKPSLSSGGKDGPTVAATFVGEALTAIGIPISPHTVAGLDYEDLLRDLGS